MEKISVIIPCYNVEKYFRKCLESVINQTYKNIEIIIIDDGSTDGSGKIADEFAKIDNRIKVIHKENEGVSVARNIGLKNATGDYVAFSDSDDILNEKIYETLYNLIKEYNSDVSFCGLDRIHEGEEVAILNENIIKKEISKEEALKQMLMDDNVGNYINIKMFKRQLFDGIEFPSGRTYEDVSTVYKLIHKANKIAYTNEKLYYYLVGRSGAITSTFTEKKIKDALIRILFSIYFFVTKL